jgi:hypothetical protein
MSWFQATLNLDGIRSRITTDAKFVFFDARPLRELHAALWAQGGIEVEHASLKPFIESRGMAILRDPHVVAIQQRLDLDTLAPDGPPRLAMADQSNELELSVVFQ